jgi:hypothetical protein
MIKPRCIATIRYSKQEIEIHINALKTFLGNEKHRMYFGPYEKLLRDMKAIKEQMLDKESEAVLNRDKEEQIVKGSVCQE